MTLKNTMGLSILLASLLMTACESKDKIETITSQMGGMMQAAGKTASVTQKIYLEGTITGQKDGKPFTETYDKQRPQASLQTKGSEVLLNIDSRHMAIMLIGQSKGVGTYHGVGSYDAKELNFIKAEMNIKTMGVEQMKILEKKVEITEDSATDIKGTVSFKTESPSGETHSIEGEFAFKKIIIDPDDKQALLKLIELNDDYIASASIALRKDKDFIYKAIMLDSSCFRSADASLKKDKAFVLSVVKEKPAAILMAIDESLAQDKDFAIEMLKVNKKVIHYLPSGLKKDKDVIAASKKTKDTK